MRSIKTKMKQHDFQQRAFSAVYSVFFAFKALQSIKRPVPVIVHSYCRLYLEPTTGVAISFWQILSNDNALDTLETSLTGEELDVEKR